MTMTSQFADMTSFANFFWGWRVSFINFSYWYKFHVIIITGFIVTKMFVYKGLTRNREIRNTQIWVLPNIWRLEQVWDTIFGTNVSNEMILNTAKCQGYSFCRFWVKGVGGEVKSPCTTGINTPVNNYILAILKLWLADKLNIENVPKN